MKKISFLSMIEGVYAGTIYSIIQSLAMPDGYAITLGFGMNFLIGLMTYVTAGVIDYGVDLQQLSDDVV